jgi:hypothetical protein
MRHKLHLALAITCAAASLAVSSTSAVAQPYYPGSQQGYYSGSRVPQADIWVENESEYFRRGDRMNVRFSVSEDSYVAVVHIDSDGNMDFVYPASPWDNEYVRGRQIHNVSARQANGWTVRGRPGIGYFYILASPTPLDFSYFRGRNGSPWEWGYAGRAVHGDPFLAFDQVARMLLPRWPNSQYADNYYGYNVDGLHRYPTYACSNQRYDSGWGWNPSYGSCDRMDYFLRDDPYYYDTRRYRGDRDVYLREYRQLDPRHGFKEDPEAPARGVTPSSSRPANQGSGRAPTQPNPRPSSGVDRREPVPAQPTPQREPEPASTSRPSAQGRVQQAPAQERERPTPSGGSQRAPATSDGNSTEPARRPAP